MSLIVPAADPLWRYETTALGGVDIMPRVWFSEGAFRSEEPGAGMLKIRLVAATGVLARMREQAPTLALSALAIVMSVVTTPLPAHAQEGTLPAPDGEIILTIAGQIAQTNLGASAVFDEAMLANLPSAVLETTTVVTDGLRQFDGFLMRDLLALVGAEGKTVTATALNDYVIDIPVEDFERFDVLVATHMDGERLLPRDMGPLWIVYPRDDHAELQDIRYDYRWVWQLVRLDVE